MLHIFKKLLCFPICINMLYHSKRRQNLLFDISSPLLLFFHTFHIPFTHCQPPGVRIKTETMYSVTTFLFCQHFFSHQVRVICPLLMPCVCATVPTYHGLHEYLTQHFLVFINISTNRF